MRETANPFTPTFGKIPAVLAGRDALIQELETALMSGGGDPNLCSVFMGPRGIGKTVLLAYMAQRAESMGWVVTNVTARSGMLEDIIERATEAADRYVAHHSGPRLTSITVPALFGATWEYRKPASGNWRTRMNNLLDTLQQHDMGLLVTIDEIDPRLEELIDFTAVYQHFVRENRRVSVFMAGLPANISALLSDRSASFLRRAAQHQLGRIPEHDVRHAIEETIIEAGKTVESDALDVLTSASDGFAYMVQLVGFRAWAAASQSRTISSERARVGAEQARKDFIFGVVKRTCQELSDGDLAFLEAMLPDHGAPSKVADVASRMGKTPNYARVYRQRLLDAGVISVPRRGSVSFELPLLREYLENETM